MISENVFANVQEFKAKFHEAVIPMVVIDGFLEEKFADVLFNELPDPVSNNFGKSRDYIFAKNKYEKSAFGDISPACKTLSAELLSSRFESFLQQVTGQEVFVDPDFHGGGLHQGGVGSFLNLHADFNYHPVKKDWFRNLNILIYLNKNWIDSYGGELKIVNKKNGESSEIEPIFNRCVIMFTRDYTLHGYDPINFPAGEYRRSIAAYAYSIDESSDKTVRSTKWYADDGGVTKKCIGLLWPQLVKLKSRAFGSGTSRNK